MPRKNSITRVEIKPEFMPKAQALLVVFGLGTYTDLVGFLIANAEPIAKALGHEVPIKVSR